MLLLAGDSIVLTCVLLLTFYMRSNLTHETLPLTTYVPVFGIVLVGNAIWSFWRGIYPGYGICAIAELRTTFYTLTGVFATVAIVSFLTRDPIPYSRSILLLSWILSIPILFGCRTKFRKFLSKRDWYGIPAIIVGQHSMAVRIVDSLQNHASIGLKPIIIIDTDTSQAEYGYHAGVPIISGLDNINALCKRYGVSHGIVTVPDNQSALAQNIVSNYAQHLSHITFVGENVHPSVNWISNTRADILMSNEIEQRLMEPALRLKKRLLDLVLSVPLFVVALPLMAFIALYIKLTSKGPVFFRHMRVGQYGKQFVMNKFRTMVPNAEEVLLEILNGDPVAYDEWQRFHKLKNDPRVSRFGSWLRKYSLDELPQLYNVLKGDMSLVGPRPYISKELHGKNTSEIRAFLALYRSTKPGITGLWQVSVRNEAEFNVRTHIDLYYMRNWSLFLDIYILMRTISVVLTGRGSY